jgi:hypothetical protein
MANRFDIAKVSIGHAIQSRRYASPGPSVAQASTRKCRRWQI